MRARRQPPPPPHVPPKGPQPPPLPLLAPSHLPLRAAAAGVPGRAGRQPQRRPLAHRAPAPNNGGCRARCCPAPAAGGGAGGVARRGKSNDP
jgi:hypothetical protein